MNLHEYQAKELLHQFGVAIPAGIKVTSQQEAIEAAGAEINEVDKQPFIDAMKPVYDKHVTDPVLKKMVEDVQATQ